MIQKPNRGSAASQLAITAQAIFGMPEGSHVVLRRTMSDFIFNLLSSKAPAVGSALRAIDQQTATLATANDDAVKIVLDKPITLSASGSSPSATYDAVAVSLSRSAQGLFDLGITATMSGQGAEPLGYMEKGLTARQEGGDYIFSAGTEPHLKIGPASDPNGAATIGAYTAPYLSGLPAALRAFAPATVGLVSLTRLPDGPAGSSDQEKTAQKVVSDAGTQRAGPQKDAIGLGVAGAGLG